MQLSQEALVFEAGANRTYMSKLEKGGSYPGLFRSQEATLTSDLQAWP
jgi:hypothetical protein